MIGINLALIATAIEIVASIWKFANSISQFGHSVDKFRKSMDESKGDRLNLHKKINGHEVAITRINTQYEEIKEDLSEIKRRVS